MKQDPTDNTRDPKSSMPDNSDRQGIDKDPKEEKGKQEQVTEKDLKGKKVDADPSTEDGKPVP